MWSLFYLGNGSPSPMDESWILLLLAPLVSLFGATGWMVSQLASNPRKRSTPLVTQFRVVLPALGLIVSILGATLSLTYSMTYGAVLAATGLFGFLAGLVLAAAFPPEATGGT